MDIKLGEKELIFAEIIWENEPISSGKLAKETYKKLNWKHSTTYTMLKRICDKGVFKNENGTVVSRISKDEYKAMKCEQFVDMYYGGSIARLLAALASVKPFSQEDIAAVEKYIISCK